MEEVRFEDYEKRERRTQRFFQDEKEREETPFLVKAGIGVAVAAGALTLAHRSGAMRKVAKFLDTEGQATIQAARETLDNQGSFVRGRDKLTIDRMKVLKDSFQERRTKILGDIKQKQGNVLESRDMRLAQELDRRERIVGGFDKDGKPHGEVAYNIQEGYRHAAVMEKIRETHPDIVGDIDRALANEGQLGVLDWGSDEKLKLILKSSKNTELHTNEVWDTLRKAREEYKGKDMIVDNPEAKKLVEGMQERLRHETANRMHQSIGKDGAFKSFVVGHKQATVDDILRLNQAGKIKINPHLQGQIDDAFKYNKDFGQTVFDDNLYLSTKNDELFDYKSFSKIKRDTAEWWSATIPGGLIRLRDILNIKEAREKASLYVFQRGTTLSSLNGHMGIKADEALNEEMVFMYGKFVRLNDIDAVNNDAALNILNPKRDMYLTSSQFGTSAKMHRHMSGLMTDNERARNPIAKFLDVGEQDKDSTFTQGISVATKFFKGDWERNYINRLTKEGLTSSEDYFKMNTYFKLNTEALTPRVLNNLKGHFSKDVENFIQENNISFSKEEDILKLFTHFGKRESKRKGTAHTDMVKLFRQFDRNPDKVLNRKTPVGESNPIIGHHTRLQTGQDEINQQTSLFLVQDMLLARSKRSTSSTLIDEAGPFRKEVQNMYYDGRISEKEMQGTEFLLNFAMFRSQGHEAFDNTTAAVMRVGELFTKNADFQKSMKDMARKTNPIWERYSSARPENLVGDEYLAINDSDIAGVFNKMLGIHSSMRERLEGLKDLGKQLSPFTGRKNMEDVTTLNLFATYFPTYRLQDALGNMGLGFSDQSMANGASMLFNIMAKRVFPVYGAVEGIKYVDYEMDKHTGEGLDERWENYKANNRLDDAMTRTDFEIYEEKRKRMLKPGIEHWEDMPSIHIPGIGPVSAGDALNNVFAPFMGKATLREEDLMTYDETMEDLYYGTDEIRKSRYWFAGSKSAFRGDRIIEFAPNSFRKAHSDYEYTNTSSTGEEYWGNHILPTLENPLGGLAYLFGKDPYWYEKKHYYDRPYMLTGELFNPNTMILGDIGNATIGKLVKPVKEMHPEYWGDPQLIYEEQTSELGNRPDEPIRTRITPAGRIEYEVLATPDQYGSSNIQRVDITTQEGDAVRVMNPERLSNPNQGADYVMSPELDDDGNTTGGYVATKMSTNETVYVPANVAGDMTMAQAFAYANTENPEGSQVKAVMLTTSNPSYQTQVSTQPRAMFDQEYAYRQEIMYRKMQNIQDPRSGSWRMQEGYENWSEPLGVYKWIIGDELLGSDPYKDATTIQRADEAYNVSNRFWESELGSLGGAMSEIGRRFIRRDSGQLDKYNPIRNTMPEWLPGEEYFINFQTGDPYTKLPHGEYRLPGEAYESLNELHPDETGRYGAFDKFKILADVAPFSDEYNFWSQYLLDTLPEGTDLRKEATQIRKQVSQRRTKQEFQPYRFKGNDVVYQDVTVDKFLDDYTFTTKELGDQPIRIAGMEYRKKADGVLQNYFQEGDKVTIGVSEDPNARISQDTYGTMRAVIFNELGNINKDIIERGRMVENQNDFSAAGVHARFTPKEIKQGSRWETLAHTSSPLNTKFLQVRTAVEEYERDQIYGKDWATWENFMLNDYIMPTLQGLGRFDNPMYSAGAGAVTGAVLGRFFLKGGRPTKVAMVTGALFGLGSNMFFKNHERKTGEAWIPERRRVEHDLNEYFDVLKYLKNEGLYQKAREEIAHETGYDIEDFATIIEDQKSLTKEKRAELEAEKKQLYLEQPKGWEERRKEINAELQTISEDFQNMYLPDNMLQALQYKEERDSTLYGVDPYDDRMKVMQAFPYKDKRFFNDFVNANEEEREKLLKLLPDNEKRVYKALWGMGLEEQKPLEYYMEKYNIPDWSWEGWRPEYNLDDIKVKAVQEAGLDLSDFNFWEDDVAASQYVPDLNRGGNEFRGEQSSNFQGFQALRQNLINILQGQGLQNVRVSVSPSNGSESQVSMTYRQDRSREIEENLRQNMSQYL